MPKKESQFQEHIKSIGKNINAYCKSVDSTHACIVLHEHLGLVQNIVQTSEFFMGKKITLMVPDLFLSVTEKTLLNNEFNAILMLPFSKIIETIEVCVNYLKKSHKKIILMGFSTGSAYGFKVLEKLPNTFDTAFLFYGLPNIKSFNPSLIKTKTISIYGSDDKIKYLSDFNTYQEFIQKCSSNKNIKFERINGEGHGFANPESTNFSDGAVVKSRDIVREHLPKDLVPSEEGSGCILF